MHDPEEKVSEVSTLILSLLVSFSCSGRSFSRPLVDDSESVSAKQPQSGFGSLLLRTMDRGDRILFRLARRLAAVARLSVWVVFCPRLCHAGFTCLLIDKRSRMIEFP